MHQIMRPQLDPRLSSPDTRANEDGSGKRARRALRLCDDDDDEEEEVLASVAWSISSRVSS